MRTILRNSLFSFSGRRHRRPETAIALTENYRTYLYSREKRAGGRGGERGGRRPRGSAPARIFATFQTSNGPRDRSYRSPEPDRCVRERPPRAHERNLRNSKYGRENCRGAFPLPAPARSSRSSARPPSSSSCSGRSEQNKSCQIKLKTLEI